MSYLQRRNNQTSVDEWQETIIKNYSSTCFLLLHFNQPLQVVEDHRNHYILVVTIVLGIFDRTKEVVIHVDLLMTDEIDIFVVFLLDGLRF